MRRAAMLLLLLGACSGGGEANDPQREACARQANEDPTVREMLMKAAGTSDYEWQNSERIRLARQDATLRCLRTRGLAPKGGVERPQPR